MAVQINRWYLHNWILSDFYKLLTYNSLFCRCTLMRLFLREYKLQQFSFKENWQIIVDMGKTAKFIVHTRFLFLSFTLFFVFITYRI